jgi:hypothetical protein
VLVGTNVAALLQLHQAALYGTGADAQHGGKAGLARSAPVAGVRNHQQSIEHALGGGAKRGVGIGTNAQFGVQGVNVVDSRLPLVGAVGAGTICFGGAFVRGLVMIVGVRLVASARWSRWSARVEPVQRFAGRQAFQLGIYPKGVDHLAALGVE